jgi:predicted transcriptional regulator
MRATSVRLNEDLLGRVDHLANAMNRSRAWVIKAAVERYLDYEEWFVSQVESALENADAGNLTSEEEVNARFKKLGVDAR